MQNLEFKILAYLSGELDEKESRQLEQWVASSDANQKAFSEAEKIYKAAELNTEKFEPNVDRAWDAIVNAIDQKKVSSKAVLYRLAAMITLAIGLGFSVLYMQNNTEQLVATTAENEIKKIELADGSVIWLNENSVFKYPKELSDGERIVSLSGQAYFDIAKDPQRPFRITGEKATVEVLGTSFDLVSKANYANVNVNSGLVAFALTNNDEVKIVLAKGDQATVEKNTLKKNESYDDNASSWMTKDFIFKSSPLSQVVETLSDHFNVKFKVDDTIKNCLITSAFENKELDEILETLQVIANIKHEKKGKTIRLTGPGC